MKVTIQGFMLVLLLMLLANTSMAADSLTQFDGIKGRSYHAEFYEQKACDSCHLNKSPLSLPEDDACLACHDLEELVKTTARPEDEKWQNPHNNMHYGKDVPCMECHGEHNSRKPMCAGCHSFNYPNFQK